MSVVSQRVKRTKEAIRMTPGISRRCAARPRMSPRKRSVSEETTTAKVKSLRDTRVECEPRRHLREKGGGLFCC